MAPVYAERRLIEPRPTGARLSALAQAALVYTVLVYTEWIPETNYHNYGEHAKNGQNHQISTIDAQLADKRDQILGTVP